MSGLTDTWVTPHTQSLHPPLHLHNEGIPFFGWTIPLKSILKGFLPPLHCPISIPANPNFLFPHQSLLELHKRRKAVTEPEVRYYMTQMLKGVLYLHNNRVIHRDLKLGNIFLNDDMEVKIGSFRCSICPRWNLAAFLGLIRGYGDKWWIPETTTLTNMPRNIPELSN